MPIVVLDTNVLQVMGGHPEWVEPGGELPSDPQFLRLPKWYQYEIWALGAVNEVIPRCCSTAWVPAPSALAELSRGGGAARRSLSGWGGEIADWARRWFWDQLERDQMSEVMRRWMQAQQLDLSFLRDPGDRSLCRLTYALRPGYSLALTLDCKSLWRHQRLLEEMGVRVRLPSELWDQIAPQV